MTPNQSHVAWLLASILEHQAIAERYGWNGLWETLESCMEMLAKAAPAKPQSDGVLMPVSDAEAVEVVAYRISHQLGNWKVYEQKQDWAYESWGALTYEVQDLMTVAQHKRIMAAQTGSAGGEA